MKQMIPVSKLAKRCFASLFGLLVLLFLFVPAAVGGVLLYPDDTRLRMDIELLKDAGYFAGPVSAWPLDLTQVFSGGKLKTNDPAVEAAYARLQSQWFLRRSVELSFGYRSGDPWAPGFGSCFRSQGETEVHATLRDGAWSVVLRAGMTYRNGGPTIGHFDGTAVAYDLGTWTVYGGLPDRWYGPGWDGGLTLSHNARPIPGIGLSRRLPKPFSRTIFKYVGPWRFDAFLGRLSHHREISNPYFLNFHLAIEPFPGLEMGSSRGLMLCGEGRPCDLETWARSLVGLFDADNTGTEQEPGNQVASFEAQYTFPFGGISWHPYTEIFIEDEVQDVSTVFGLRARRSAEGRVWWVRLEHVDTLANRILGRPEPGVTYDHFIYRNGYRHRGDVIGHPLGGDARGVTVEVGLVNKRGNRGWLRYRQVGYDPESMEAGSAARAHALELGYDHLARRNRVFVQGRLGNVSPRSPQLKLDEAAVEVGLQVSIHKEARTTRENGSR